MSKQSWLMSWSRGSFWVRACSGCAPRTRRAPARVFEIRTYHRLPGRLDALHKRFREHTMKIFEKHGMTNVAYWTFEDSPAKENTLIYVISHASREQAKKNWDEFRDDPGVEADGRGFRGGRQDRREGGLGVRRRDRLLAAAEMEFLIC